MICVWVRLCTVFGVSFVTLTDGLQYAILFVISLLPQGTTCGHLHALTHFSSYQRCSGVSFLDPEYLPPNFLYAWTSLPESYAPHLLPWMLLLICSFTFSYNFLLTTFAGTPKLLTGIPKNLYNSGFLISLLKFLNDILMTSL